MEKIVKKLFNFNMSMADTYFFQNRIWVILTNTREWIFEWHEEGTLWYNYDYFSRMLNYLSLTPKEVEQVIVEWAEENINYGSIFRTQGTIVLKTPGECGDVVSTNEWMESNDINNVSRLIDNVIDNRNIIKITSMDGWINTDNILQKVINKGIKEVKELPDMSGELRGYGDYYRKQKDRAKPHVLYVKDAIEKGLKLK